MKDKKKQSKEYTKPIVISVGLHALLVAALLWGTDFAMTKPEPTGQMVQAVVIDPKLVQQQAKEIRQQREKAAKKEQDRLDKLRREAEQLEKNRKAEEEQIRKLKEQQAKDAKAAREAEAARKQKEQERKAEEERVRQEKERTAKLEKERKAKEEAVRKAEQERLAKEAAIAKAEQERVAHEKAAKEAEEKAKREREAAQKAEQERIAKEKAAKEAAEKARKAKERLERERKEQEAALDDIFAGLESEASANQQAQGKFVADEVSRYSSIYIQLIQSRLLKDDYLLGKECRVNIKLIPTGTDMIVSSVNVLSGDSRVCAAAKSAIAQVPSFPMSTDSTVNQRLKDINLTVALQQ
ncbi:TPA: cell envelope integrity protein TolA [Vibrio parahaemolyticus]|uniref:cell envelope integrity protein TolA n=1 Tax=Vibrio parahaemolyticus TaxID=670 RepID=UPI0006A5BCE0|nr:cell envelope integrity protein TolA [Vibrio parahaemolyticus]EJG0948209.1 cell envelope integrity protein TolA [Vibrio parahaemolyticus O1:K58]EGQ8002599.1 cell envelope integrity protein TolA [Vibrio parahaemolyticus]EGQ8285331.1 cell envelope integrity protein TolA [Vibrio parahaemolyticus]EGQ8333634.1 cell envelope integrity protein TolA [Vibrio parahaemolyticus]EGQ9121286.1 cell envelope integrity protein TolA [Vibrio parahaemolyticus]